jgi:hypothetical protein
MAAQPLPQPNMAVITGSARTLLEEIPKIANIPAVQGAQAILDAINDLRNDLTRRLVAAFVQRAWRIDLSSLIT